MDRQAFDKKGPPSVGLGRLRAGGKAMLTVEQRTLIEAEISTRWETVADHLSDARAEIECIKVFRACLALDESLRLRMVASSDGEIRGDQCTGLRLIRGAEKLCK